MRVIAVYSGDTFGALMRRYSTERMQRDGLYRRSVYKAIEERKARRRK
jgi:hypothetical protein